MAGKVQAKGRIVCVVSGSNISPSDLANTLGGSPGQHDESKKQNENGGSNMAGYLVVGLGLLGMIGMVKARR